MIILNVTKNQGFTVSLKNTFLKILQGEGSNLPPAPAFLGLMLKKKTQFSYNFHRNLNFSKVSNRAINKILIYLTTVSLSSLFDLGIGFCDH